MDWFDYTLKGEEKPAILKDRVNYFVMGEGWKHASTLEKMNTDTLHFYLTDKPVKSFYALSDTPANESSPLKLQFNPAAIVHTATVSETGMDDTRPLTSSYLKKQYQLIFETPPFQKDLIVSGSPTANLFVSINKKDIDFNLEFYE
ncbi:CocE/NonD family hydrolase C-terminal non-catalytic domain-containing protein, partial [Bradyrhizobium sp. NBAIM08]|uniref:CocE/NonD family hydrolase C-terminal non-catalytic domain-containing protein n=1 Tax=Bradyrhizobium sp. NBAIM08 TaxID=2793815 RepID=UPI001CD3660A